MLPSSFARMIAGFAKGLYPEAEYQPVTAVRSPDGGIGILIGSDEIGTVDVGGSENNISVEV